MTKEELIKQVLNTTNIDLYNFFAKKLLTEYPEYKQKVLDHWVNKGMYNNTNIDNVIIDKDKRLYNGYNDYKHGFYYTPGDDFETEGYLNWVLRND